MRRSVEVWPETLDREAPRTVAAGEIRGHLEVVEEVAARGSRNGRCRRWRCRCLVAKDGRPCGRAAVRTTAQLTADRYRACDQCAGENRQRQRLAYAQRFNFERGK